MAAIQGPGFSQGINSVWKLIQGGFSNTAGANALGIRLIRQGVPSHKLFTAPDVGGNATRGPWALWAADRATLDQANQLAQGGGSGGGSAAGAGAPGAVQAGGVGVGQGGVRFQTAAANVTSFAPERSGNFFGLDSFTPPDKLGPDYVPYETNWDDLSKLGSRCVRRGTAKLGDDIHTVTMTRARMTTLANSDLTASTDYFLLTLPDATTHAFWFDTTGSDSEPAGSGAADASTEVTTTGLSANAVASAIATAVNTADIGLIAAAVSADLWLIAVVGGSTWTLAEFVTDADWTITAFGNVALDSSYEGVSITRIPGNGDVSDQLLLAFADNDIGSTMTSLPVSLHVITSVPTWGYPMAIQNTPGPTLTLSQIAGPKVRATVVHDHPAVGRRNNTVRQIVIRYDLEAFPADIDGRDNLDSITFASADRAAWTGVSTTYDTTESFSAADVVYVTAWTVTLEGWSRPSRKRITIT